MSTVEQNTQWPALASLIDYAREADKVLVPNLDCNGQAKSP